MKPLTLTEPSSEALGRRTTLIAIAPSSRLGMNSVPTLVAATPAAKKRLERPDPGQAIASLARGRAAGRVGRNDQAESRTRPLARRAESTLRPPTVFMRARKPWFRARRIFEGWNVRFMAFPIAVRSSGPTPRDCPDCLGEKPCIRTR